MSPPEHRDCEGAVLGPCPSGWTGPMCDVACQPGQPCDYSMICHSWGAMYGLSAAGTFLFALDPASPPWLLTAQLYAFILGHPASLGCEAQLSMWDIDLKPHHAFRSNDGLLTLLRFDQSYRQIPVFGADAVVTVIATGRGAIGIRGAIIDGREDFDHVEVPSSQAQAEAGLVVRVAELLAVPPELLSVDDVRLVAFPRLKKIGWAATVYRELVAVGTAVIEADPAPMDWPQLIYFHRDVAEGLADEAPITVHAEDPTTNPTDGMVMAVNRTEMFDMSPIIGSTNGPEFVLGNERVFAVDGTGAADIIGLLDIPALASPANAFLDVFGTPEFPVQNAFAAVSDMYVRTDLIMAGKWDSALGADSSFPPELFKPRTAVWANAPGNVCEFFESSDGTSFCAGAMRFTANPDLEAAPNEYEQPLGGTLVDGKVVLEPLGHVTLEAFADAGKLTHEFGHVVDYFAKTGLMDSGFTCKNCPPSCMVGSTNEVGSLTESWAQFASLWYFRDLYAFGASSPSCDIATTVSQGGNASAHHEACRPTGNQYSVFLRPEDDDCPEGIMDFPGTKCDRPGPEDADPTTGLCPRNYGYRVDSAFNALWELLHAETCAVDPPYVCTPLPKLAEMPIGDVVGRALIHALRVNSATYQGFVDDMGVYISCNHGPQAFQEFNEVFCHHFLQTCGTPPPTTCCGNGSLEPPEDCDGDDLGGVTCTDQGFEGGVLSCTAECALDTSQCTLESPTTGESDTGVTTASTSGTGTSTSGTGVDSASASLSGPGNGGGDGCACAAGAGGSQAPWMLGALLALFSRRFRQSAVCTAVALSWLALACACVARQAGSTGVDGTSTTDATAGATSSGAPGSSTSGTTSEPQPFRRFGQFHRDSHEVGDSNSGPTLYPWVSLDVRADGKLSQFVYGCTSNTITHKYTWEHADDGAIRVVPDEFLPNKTFRWGADEVAAVTISEGDGCDDIIVFIDYTDESGVPDLIYRYVLGELCAEGEACDFTFVWCDGKGPEPCE